MDQFDCIAGSFPSIKMDYDNGKIVIIDFQGKGHKKDISNFVGQFF
jgi:hypothetical protein